MSATTKIAVQREVSVDDESSHEKIVEIITGEHAFHDLKEDWDTLAMEANVPVFMTHDWLSAWWKHFGIHKKRRLYILVIYQDEKLIGIAPFFKGETSIGKLVIHQRLQLMGCGVEPNEFLGFRDDYGYSDSLDIIVHPDFQDEVADLLVDFLYKSGLKVNMVTLTHLSEKSFIMSHLLPRLEAGGQSFNTEKIDVTPFLTIPESIPKYFKNLRSSVRRRLRQTRRAVDSEKNHGYELEDVSAPENVDYGLTQLQAMHQERWNKIGFPGLFFDPRFTRFLDDFTKRSARNGWLWFKLGKDDKGYSAARLAFYYGNRYYDYISGFDDEAPSSKRRPGIGLLVAMLEDAIEDPSARTLELLRGGEKYKFEMNADSRYNWRLEIPLNSSGASPVRFAVTKLLYAIAAFYSSLSQELVILHVHFQKAGLLKMLVSYAKFRYQTLEEKIKELDLFSKNNK